MQATANFLLLVVTATLTFTHARTVAGAAAECLPHERDALLTFKRGITHDPLHRLASWRRVDDCCRWSGVRCNNRTGGHVFELRLRGVPTYDPWMEIPTPSLGLVGQITPSLLSLERLEHLDLSWNFLERLTGRLPEFLGSMNNLRYLNLSGIPFTGMLPPQLGNLSKLHYLDLSYTEFTGMLPPQLGNLSKLHYLDLSDSSVLSTDLSWLTNLPSLHYLNLNMLNLSMVDDWLHVVNMIPSLKVLYLSACSLESANQSLPHINLTKLEELDLSLNQFDHPVGSCWFWNLTSLKYLDLGYTDLYGQIPNALGDMTSLQVFDSSFNHVRAIIAPNLLRNLCNLKILCLESSLSSGNITELFESLLHCPSKKLQKLHLAGNNFTGTLPTGIGQFTSLVTIDLSKNKLTGPVPFEITMLTNLTTMYLSSNDLDGVITEEQFAGLHSLENIGLSHNHLKIAVDPEWSPPFRLQSARFASCQMGPQFPAWLQWSVDIDDIDISSNGITDQLPDWFSTAFSKVTSLDISNNRISGGLPPNMETMQLIVLDISNNRISGGLPPNMENMSLLSLSLGSNQITGQIPSLPRNLTSLTISKNALSGRVPESICKSQELEFLDLADNLLEGQFPQCSGKKNLAGLFLSNNRFSGKFPSILQNCRNLVFLDLSRNNFSGRLPMWIGDIVRLQYLQLSYNKFYGNIPSSITNLSHLFSLNLAGNRLSGVIPWHLSNLTMMASKYYPQLCGGHFQIPRINFSVVTKRQELYIANCMFNIDLSSNCLTGGIPEDIASLALINLNLSINFLSGKILDKIGSMQSLESLDLSRNKLFGEIPLGLSNLTYLSYLDLSYNNLSGRIPSGSQLDSLYANNPFMYSGNNGLCGPPLQTNCSGGIASKQGDGDHKRTTAHVPDPMLCFHLGLGSGFVVALWVIFCTMLFKKTWRIAYFRLFDKVYDKIYVFVVVTWASLAQKTATN